MYVYNFSCIRDSPVYLQNKYVYFVFPTLTYCPFVTRMGRYTQYFVHPLGIAHLVS